MNDYWSTNYNGEPFILFNTPHLIAIAIVTLACLAMFFWRSPQESSKRLFRYGLAAVLIANEILWHVWNYSNGIWSVQTMLPLHLCSVLVFLSAIMLVTKNVALYEVCYFMGISGATQAILTPDAGAFGYPHVRFFQVFISHGSIVLAAIYMTVVEGFRPYLRSTLRVFLLLVAYAGLVGLVNGAVGSNYLFIARKPDTASLIDVLAPWPWYVFELGLIALVMIYVLYIPFAIKDWRASRTVEFTPSGS